MSLFLHRALTVRRATDTIVDDFTAELRSRKPPGYGPACLGRPLRLDFTYRVRSILCACALRFRMSGLISLRRGETGNNNGANNNGTHTKCPAFVVPALFSSHMAAGFDYTPSACRMFRVGPRPRALRSGLTIVIMKAGTRQGRLISTTTATPVLRDAWTRQTAPHLLSKPSVARWAMPDLPLIGQIHRFFRFETCTDDFIDCVLVKKTDVSPSVDFKGVMAH
jgi:hypothetical protein